MPKKPPPSPTGYSYVAGQSWPPESEAEYDRVHSSVYARTETPTGTHDLRRLLELQGQRDAAALLDENNELKAKLAHDADRKERFWDAVITGLLVAAGAGFAGGLATLIYELSKTLH